MANSNTPSFAKIGLVVCLGVVAIVGTLVYLGGLKGGGKILDGSFKILGGHFADTEKIIELRHGLAALKQRGEVRFGVRKSTRFKIRDTEPFSENKRIGVFSEYLQRLLA